VRTINVTKNTASEFTVGPLAELTNVATNLNATTVKLSNSDMTTSAISIKNMVSDSMQICANLESIKNSADFLVNGPCNGSDSTAVACCGNGNCVAGITTTYTCSCKGGFSGMFCQINGATFSNVSKLSSALIDQVSSLNASDTNNMETIVASIKQIVIAETISLDILNKTLNMMSGISN
jgi:hypothetical protein